MDGKTVSPNHDTQSPRLAALGSEVHKHDLYGVEPTNAEHYQDAIAKERRLFDLVVESSKPLTEFIVMMSTSGAMGGLTVFLIEQMAKNGWSDRLALAALVSATLWFKIAGAVGVASQAAAKVYLYKLARRFRLPYIHAMEGRVIKAIWETVITLVGFLATIGVSAAGFQLIKIGTGTP